MGSEVDQLGQRHRNIECLLQGLQAVHWLHLSDWLVGWQVEVPNCFWYLSQVFDWELQSKLHPRNLRRRGRLCDSQILDCRRNFASDSNTEKSFCYLIDLHNRSWSLLGPLGAQGFSCKVCSQSQQCGLEKDLARHQKNHCLGFDCHHRTEALEKVVRPQEC